MRTGLFYGESHLYLGDKFTRRWLSGMLCSPVHTPLGRHIIGRNGHILVHDTMGRRFVVPRRKLRRRRLVQFQLFESIAS